MTVTAEFTPGHAERPSNDGWFHCTTTDRVRITLDGPRAELAGVIAAVNELRGRGAVVLTAGELHDGPGAGSCAACKP